MFSSKFFSYVIFLLTVIGKSAFGDSADKYFKLCHRASSDFEKCIQNSITEAKPYLMKGIPEIGLSPLEPLAFPPLNFKENNRNMKISAMFDPINLSGLSNMTVGNVKVKGDVDSEMTINLTITSPVFHSYGKWSGKGRAFNFNINGKGDFDVNFTQTEFRLTIKGCAAVNEKDGKKYFSVNSVTLDPVLRKANIRVTNLFPGDEALTKTANNFMNRNSQFLLRTVKQYPVNHLGGEFEKIIRIVFGAWPIDELLPE